MAEDFGYINASASPFDPVYSLADPTKYFNIYAGNPAASEDPRYLKEELDVIRVLASIYAEYAIPGVKGLSVRSELSFDIMQANRNFWMSKELRKEGLNGARIMPQRPKRLILMHSLSITELSVIIPSILSPVLKLRKEVPWYRVMEGLNLVGSLPAIGHSHQCNLHQFSISR